MRTLDLFPETRQPRSRPRVLMHVDDAGDGGDGKPICVMRCARCGATTDWLRFETVTEAKRGIPCEACNADEAPDSGVRAGTNRTTSGVIGQP